MPTWNTDIPKTTNQILDDVADIEENLQELHDVIHAIADGTLGTTTAANFRVDALGTRPSATTGISDGTNNYDFPTNNTGNCVFMVGDNGAGNNTMWMYLNAAPTGWKVSATGGDTVLAISGGSQAYNVNGGNPDSAATWSRGDTTLSAAQSGVPAHQHYVDNSAAGGASEDYWLYGDKGSTLQTANNVITKNNTAAAASSAHNHGSTWRPSASVGKLMDLDTA